MNYFNFNGKTLEEGTPVAGADNRGLRYGDGLFETIKFKNEELIFANEHFARLWKGMKLLNFDIPKLFTPENLEEQIIDLVKKNHHNSSRIRLSVYRGDGGLYDPKNHNPNYIIQSWPLNDHSSLNENGLQLCIYDHAKKMIDKFSNIKHNNYLPYFMGALFAKQGQYNDAVILNNHDRICDSTIANIFIIKNEMVHTPALGEGCVAGIMREFITRNISSHGYRISETKITKEFLLNADEVFITNSIYNMRWVATVDEKKFSNVLTKKIFDAFRKTNAGIFC